MSRIMTRSAIAPLLLGALVAAQGAPKRTPGSSRSSSSALIRSRTAV
jgi:hypothetical protein